MAKENIDMHNLYDLDMERAILASIIYSADNLSEIFDIISPFDLSFYSVVGGWVLNYRFMTATPAFAFKTSRMENSVFPTFWKADMKLVMSLENARVGILAL